MKQLEIDVSEIVLKNCESLVLVICNSLLIYGVGAIIAAIQAASHTPKAALHAANAGVAAITAPSLRKRTFFSGNYFTLSSH